MRIHSVADPRICSIRLPDMRVVELKVTYKGTECECRGLVLQVSALPGIFDYANELFIHPDSEKHEIGKKLLSMLGTL